MKNFAKLKDSIYNEVLTCLKEDRTKAKRLIKGYVNILKQHPTLKEAFHIHHNFEEGSFINEDVKHGFIIENLNAIRKLSKEDLRLGLDALDKFIKENKIQYATDLNALSEKISSLMMNINRVDRSVENNKAIEYIINEVTKREINTNQRKPVSHKIFKEVATKNYHNKYNNLSEDEKKIIKFFFTGNKKMIKDHYNSILSTIKENINQKIQTADNKDTKIKLYEVKDRLYDNPTEITLEHFNKLLQLKESLK